MTTGKDASTARKRENRLPADNEHLTSLNHERVSRTVSSVPNWLFRPLVEKAVHDPHWSRDQAAAQ